MASGSNNSPMKLMQRRVRGQLQSGPVNFKFEVNRIIPRMLEVMSGKDLRFTDTSFAHHISWETLKGAMSTKGSCDVMLGFWSISVNDALVSLKILP